MMKKMAKGIIVSSAIAVLPVLGNTKMFYSAHIWIIFAIGFLASLFQPDYKIVKDKSNTRDKGTEVQIIWSVYISQLCAVCEATYLRFPYSVRWDTIAVSALMVMITGLVLRTWAIYTLGRYFTMHLAIQKEHKVIRTGPYRFFRHPSYVGAFCTYMGTTVFLHTWYSLIIAAIILPLAWIRRIHYEEKLLLEELGEEYKEYSKSVKRAVPRLW